MTLNDETLTAYLDGELTAEKMTEITAQIKSSPQLAERVENMRLTDNLLAQTYHAIDAKPMPTEILAMLEAFPQNKDKTDDELADNILPFKKPRSISKSPIWQMAIAASVALFIGLGTGRTILAPTSSSDISTATILAQQSAGIIGPENSLFPILENQPSATAVTISGSGDTIIKPIMTFRTADNTYCREFEVMSGQTGTRSVACRTGDAWIVKVSVVALGNISSQEGNYQTASQADNPIIDSMILDLIEGDALSADHEARIMQQNWNQK